MSYLWNESELSTLRSMAAEGASAWDIARALPRRTVTAVQIKARKEGAHLTRPLSPNEAVAVKYLKEQAMTPVELSAAIRTCLSTTYVVIARLRQRKLIHITRWERRVRGAPAPYYVAGPGRNAPRPTAQARKERSQQRRKRALAQRATAVSGADPAAAWLFNKVTTTEV